MTFTLKQRPDGMWEAQSDPVAFYFILAKSKRSLRTEGAIIYAHTNKGKCVDGFLDRFFNLMLAPLGQIVEIDDDSN